MNAVELLAERFREDPARTFVVDALQGRDLTYGELDASARAVAADLRRSLPRGARVATILGNSSACASLYFGCLYGGLVTVPVNPALGREEIGYVVERSGASLVVVSPETARLVDLDAARARGVDVRVLDDGRGAPAGDLQELWRPHLSDPDFELLGDACADDTLTVVYTSGTTARPVGVVHRVRDLVGNAAVFCETLGIGRDNRFYGILPMSYLGGYYNLLLLPFVGGSSVVLAEAFDAAGALGFWRGAAAHEVNTLWLVPTIMSILLELDRGDEGAAYSRERVRLALCGTAPLPVAVREAFEERYGVVVHENYALSETTFLTSTLPGRHVRPGSVGGPLPGIELRIAAPVDDEGEIEVRTPYLLERYESEDPERAGLPLTVDGWFRTGDIGRIDDGELFVTGRLKDVVIRGGINISPAAIENAVYGHPAVVECAVVGLPHAIYGEEPVAVVRLAPPHSLRDVQRELEALCTDRLGSAKRPGRFVELDELPHNAAGKVRKRELRLLVAERLGETLGSVA